MKEFTVNGAKFVMVEVPGGTFTMGATAEQGNDFQSNELPTHSVTISNYWIGQTEVTQELWTAVMGSNPNSFQGDNLPVNMVDWNDCQEFISQLNHLTGEEFRLPTEAEWEFAARGGRSHGTKYAGSDNIGEIAWIDTNTGGKTHAVATKKPNTLGLYDMSGNLWEWCLDRYGKYKSYAQTNPQGPSSGSERVIRGGGWNYDARGCRVSFRSGTTSERQSTVGFRLAR